MKKIKILSARSADKDLVYINPNKIFNSSVLNNLNVIKKESMSFAENPGLHIFFRENYILQLGYKIQLCESNENLFCGLVVLVGKYVFAVLARKFNFFKF